jgi:alpha-beta hydrolase superfamily lysophospholipase
VRRVALVLGSAVVLMQALAFIQAWSMTHFTTGGPRTGQPGNLEPLDQLGVLLTGVRVPRPENTRTPEDYGLSAEPMRIARPANAILEAWFVPGTNRSIVLAFPAYATSKADLLPCAKLLHELGYSVLLVDYWGVGGSTGSGTTLGFREAADVAATLAEARRLWPDRPLVLFGSSMGGAAVLRAVAREGARPDAVIVEAVFDDLVVTTRNRFTAMGLPPTPLAELLLFWGGLQHGVNCFDMRPVDDAGVLACPVLLLQGGADERVGVSGAARLRAAFGSRAQAHVYPGVDHTLLASERPVEWSRDVGAFLSTLGTVSGGASRPM